MPRIRKRRTYGRLSRSARANRRVFSEGCIKITVGKNRVVIWNNCGREIAIGPGKALKAAITSRVKYELDYGSATAIFAEPVEVRTSSSQEDSAPDPKDYDWV